MSNDNDNKQLIILALGIAGIVVGFFAYLIYTQNKEKEQKFMQQSLYQPSNDDKYDERIYKMLENHQNWLQNQQSKIDYILTTKTHSQTNQSTNNVIMSDIDKLEVPKSKPLHVDSFLNIKSAEENKRMRQIFGML